MTCFSCSINNTIQHVSESKLRATAKVDFNLIQRISSVGNLKIIPTFSRKFDNQRFLIESSFKNNVNMDYNPIGYTLVDNSDIKSYLSVSGVIYSRLLGESNIPNIHTDKFWGNKLDFAPYEKLYPVEDIYFINKETNEPIEEFSNNNIYSIVDEGVFTNNYTNNNLIGELISDDSNTQTFPFNVFSDGDLEYKFVINKPLSVAKKSYFALRASAPFDSYKDRRPQAYKIYDIKLEDPNNNLIIQYEDIEVRGDTYFTTYIASPKINNLLLPTWNPDYPLMDENGDYTLKFSISFDCSQYPFSSKFNDSFEDSCIISTENDDTSLKNLLISSIEIGNSGGIGILKDNYLLCHLNSEESKKVIRSFVPSQLFINSFDNGIYPQSSSVWVNDLNDSNETLEGANSLLSSIKSKSQDRYIKLESNTVNPNSLYLYQGRLILKFNNELDIQDYTKFINSANDAGFSNPAVPIDYTEPDIYFDAIKLYLKIIAKKEDESVVSYPIDVVGYSDDKLLHVTSPVGGFLQNDSSLPYSTSNIPDVSGISNVSSSISENALSDDADYYQKDISAFGDHYHITLSPLVNSTEFKEYTIPLEIRYDPNKLGRQPRYSLSRFLDNLFIDISPLPTGAVISSIRLVVEFNPSDALHLYTLGSTPERKIGRNSVTLIPSHVEQDRITNFTGALSNIPHAFTSPSNLKTNYSRRWRGINNDVGSGAFDITRFNNYEFEFKYPTHPFLDGYVDFSNYEEYTNNIKSTDGNQIAEFVSSSDEYLDDYLYQNIGWRLSSEQLFNNLPSTPYKSIAWRSNIYDAFDRVVRVNSYINYITLGSVPLSSNGWAIFIRFTPDNTVPENHIILSKSSDANFDFILGYNEASQLYASANNGAIYVKDSLSWENYQYPLSVLVTYNDNNEGKLRLYTDNELIDNFNNFRGQSDADNYTEQFSNINISYCNGYNNDLPMFIHEFGLTSGTCNIVNGVIDRKQQQTSVNQFFKSHRMHFSQIGDTNYRSDQYTYIDDNVSGWHLGAFKICSFSPDFDFFTRRDGNDYLMHSLSHDGRAYSEVINQTIPNSLFLSGVAYHTQVENDFLRFNISDIPDSYGDTFFAAQPRISKTLPKGYLFNKDSICVDTIIEHDTNNNITWNNGNIGPKFIVSLYSPILNHPDRPSKDFGLVTRSIHYLKPSGCYTKLTSSFNFNDLIDTSEPWAIFDKEIYNSEFKERFFSKEIDDMYLQYDIVYPSGESFKSNIKIHSANIRIDDALLFIEEENSILNFNVSGQKYQENFVNLVIPYQSTPISDSLNLFTSGDIFDVNSSLFLYMPENEDGSNFVNPLYMTLYVKPKGSISTNDFFGSEGFGSNPPRNLTFYVSGQYLSDSNLSLLVSGQSNLELNSLNIYSIGKDPNTPENVLNQTISLLISSYGIVEDEASDNINLFVNSYSNPEPISISSNLFVEGYNPNIISTNNSLNLHTINYEISKSLAASAASISWNNTNVGTAPLISDQKYIYVDQNDEIRGVDIICYGSCSSSSNIKCIEPPVIIHDVTWYGDQEDCVDGGILRAKKTYTNFNLPSGAFKHTENEVLTSANIPYSGHFYGVRKYTGLAPGLPYYVTIEGKTGSLKPINIPNEFVEVEYNQLESDIVDGSKSLMDYNGFRFIASEEYISENSQFGKSVASKDNILAIGAPGQTIYYDSGSLPLFELESGGAVFLYKRKDRPESYEWPQDNYKSPWVLEEVLSLPNDLRRDYALQFPEDKITFSDYNISIQKTRWYAGQEGRRFGHSLDLAINHDKKSIGENSKQILVVGGPSAKWSREFPELQTDVLNIGLMVFTDKFEKTIFTELFPRRPLVELTYKYILEAIEGKDFLYRYFSNPSIRFNIKMIIYVANLDDPDATTIYWDDAPKNYPLSITVKQISRNKAGIDKTTQILNQMQSGFYEAFPLVDNEAFSGIPPLMGYFVDNSYSLGNGLQPALNQFIDFYKTYAFDNGLTDRNNIRDSGQVIQHIPDNEIDAENWILMSKRILDDVLDTGRLIESNQLRFVSTAIGEFYGSEEEFNIPPESGGKVYIFEKESGSWNLIQEIKSPNVTYGYPDQFGHSVSISDDAEVIAIGSPYINQALTIYEHKEDSKLNYYNSLYSWIYNNVNRRFAYSNALDQFNVDNNIESLYLSLSKADKFRSRVELNISEYQLIHTMGYQDIQPIGSWTFIPGAVLPTQRLGYSVDVNRDGSKIVVGAPTDSMNLFNDADVYYAHNSNQGGCFGETYNVTYKGGLPGINSSWASSVNAGSIYVLESRKYYPHNTVMEYGRFGNLHRRISEETLNHPDSGHFDYLSEIFSDKNFLRTDQVTNEIPQDVGLLFIITPEDDVLSDEITNNIINWLALGDRNLVLVGNDAEWEDKAYGISNSVINKLLRRLKSRMVLTRARNRYESLPSGYSSFNNVLPSFVPFRTTSTFTKQLPLRASGVADIRMYYGDNSTFFTQQNCREVGTCSDPGVKIQIQNRCEMPLAHLGDLRAQWALHCCNDRGSDEIYYQNWALLYGSYRPNCAFGSSDLSEAKPLANHEPIPLLTAAEKIKISVDVETVPAKFGTRYIREDLNINDIVYKFGGPEKSELDFYWKDGETSGNINIDYNITNKPIADFFVNPRGDGIIEGFGKLRVNSTEYEVDEIIDNQSRFCVSETLEYRDIIDPSIIKTSEVILLANIRGESKESLDSIDSNIGFYYNLLTYNTSLAQLNLWDDGPNTFKEAYDKSNLANILTNQVVLTQGVTYEQLLPYDNAWISNIANYELIENNKLASIKTWLSSGGKKLIITYDYYQSDDLKANLSKVDYICSYLGLSMKPLKGFSGIYKDNIGGYDITVKQDNLDSIRSIDLVPYNPIFAGTKSKTIAYQNTPITETVTRVANGNYWYMDPGAIKVSIPAVANSGYKLFIHSENHTDILTNPLKFNIGNAVSIPNLPNPTLFSSSLNKLVNFQIESDREIEGDAEVYEINKKGITEIEVQVGNNKNTIDIYISAPYDRLTVPEGQTPRTVKLMGISGIMIPVVTSINNIFIPGGGDIIGTETFKISDEIPGYTYEDEIVRPISTDNTKYCTDQCLEAGLGNQDIEDGPVLAAQEIEFITGFDAGYNRSRITVISDSSMIQGRYIKDDNIIPAETFDFIRSLYPETNFEFENAGRQFVSTTKLVSPERGSPTKYLNYDNTLSLTNNFGEYQSISKNIDQFAYESQYIPSLIDRPKVPWECETDGDKIEEIKNKLISGFLNTQSSFGSTCRISGVIDGATYIDAKPGNIPDILINKGYDYLDFDKMDIAYPGDLFGYSVAIKDNLILVGSPFSAFDSEDINAWNSNSEFTLGRDGGAGSVYMFERVQQGFGVSSWECTKKFKPTSLMGQLSGINIYSDQFGHSVTIFGDIIAIGAPNHDYSNYYDITNNSGCFVRKSFDDSFIITHRTLNDLGNSGIRDNLSMNDPYGNNTGAIYTYENKITDWENKEQSWVFVDKVVANINETGFDNERFGKTIYLSKPNRTDADYIIVAGCSTANSGEGLDNNNVGAAYTKDIMLRKPSPSLQNPNSWINIKLFGDKNSDNNIVNLNFSNNSEDNKSHYESGIIRSTNRGDIFIEVSGQDLSPKGFIAHRPYVKSVFGQYKHGVLNSGEFTLYTEGMNPPGISQINLFVSGVQ